VSGAVTADSGALAVGGQDVPHNSPAVARGLGIAVIYQQPALFPDLTVGRTSRLRSRRGSPWRRVDWKARDRRCAELLERAGVALDPARLVGTLSMPEQQVVEIAKALGGRCQDPDHGRADGVALRSRSGEPVPGDRASARTQGVGIIYISHRLEEISVDRGPGNGSARRPNHRHARDEGRHRAELIRLMVGRELVGIFPKREVALGEIALELRSVSSRAAGVRDVSLAVRRGEILGIAGLVGSGRTQLAETLFGLTPADAGRSLLGGRAVRIALARRRHRALGIAYVPEDRRRHGVMLEMPIAPTPAWPISTRSRDAG
jgi:rhamnose transport system ATP-binding protein